MNISNQKVDIMPEETLPKLLKRNYEKYGDNQVAMREKDYGIWQPFTWKDSYEKIRVFSLGLMALGFKRGDKLCILGDTKPEWVWAELAAQAAGGIPIGVFTDCRPEEVKFYLENSDSVILIAGDQEQVDKGLRIKDELPLLKKIIYWEMKGMWNYSDPILASFEEILDLGKKFEETHKDFFEKSIEKGKADDIAIFSYTSGTTGNPKGVMLSHRQLISGIRRIRETEQFSDKDNYVCFLSPAWVTDQGLSITNSMLTGMTLNFPESPETVREDIREIGPSFLFFAPSLWENLMSMVQAKIPDSIFLDRFLFRVFSAVAYRAADSDIGRQKNRWLWKTLQFIGHFLMYRDLLDKLGLSKIKACYTGGAALSPDLLKFFMGIGVNLKQMYGSSECPIIAMHRGGDCYPETSGAVVKGMEVRLSKKGEILIRGGNLFSGYYKMESKAIVDEQGWFHTGDFGTIRDDGHIIVMDRMEDVRQTAGGHSFSPQYLEIRLRFSPYIRNALVMGEEDQTDIISVINVDFENVGRWAETHRIPYTTMSDLSQKPEVIELTRGEIQKVNMLLDEWNKIRKFVNLHKDFDPDEAELTRSRKLRRKFVETGYNELRKAMFENREAFTTESEILYQDGRQGKITTDIKINAVE